MELQTSPSVITLVRNISIIHFSYKRLRNVFWLQTSPSLTSVTSVSQIAGDAHANSRHVMAVAIETMGALVAAAGAPRAWGTS